MEGGRDGVNTEQGGRATKPSEGRTGMYRLQQQALPRISPGSKIRSIRPTVSVRSRTGEQDNSTGVKTDKTKQKKGKKRR